MIDDVDVKLLESRDRSRAADLISEVFSPPIVVVALLTAVSLHASPDLPSALGWIALTTTFCAAIPYLLLLRSVRLGHVADRHLVRRADRRGPLIAALGGVLTSLGLLSWLGAPRDLNALVLAFLMGLVVMLPITVCFKASMHVAVAAGALAVIILNFGCAPTAAFVPASALVWWARVRSGRHSCVQAALGALVGSVVTLVTFIAVA